ncbi:MAG TPA: alpha/beta hydrolase [Pseudonocardia sp.]|uniref:alpha/beta hydrolase n=1 Tax=Pseudonocardia sp. TaxID=60912 RepID=UPI002C692CFE|nr:alpha/beta hydrolase [Pseudonocardia sp.]HTF48817.1 alpha/beta hydrolase [Pseudonocardia sp.]
MRQDISFRSNGRQLLGHLYLPDQLAEGERLPAVVVVGPASSTKGQVPAIYSRRLSELGYAAIAFDHTSYGESEGTPRTDEDPFTKIEDIKSAATFLVHRPEVDATRIAAVGVCAGGGYAPAAAVADRRIKAVAAVSALPDLRSTVMAAGDWRAIMGAAQGSRESYEATGRATYVPFLADGQLDPWRENGKKFYLTERNQDPNWRNQTLLWSYDKMIQFSALDAVELLAPTPLLVIAGDQAETLGQSQALYAKAQQPKELFLIEGGTHFDFYDLPEYLTPALAKIDTFLKHHL